MYVVVCARVCGRGVRFDGEALPLRRLSFALGRRRPSAGAEEPRRRIIGGGSKASACGGGSRRRTRGRGDAPAEVSRARPRALLMRAAPSRPAPAFTY